MSDYQSCGLTEWVAATQLWLLSIFCSKLVSNTVEQLDVALLWVLLHGLDESPRHGTCGLCSNGSIGTRRGLASYHARRKSKRFQFEIGDGGEDGASWGT